MNYESIYFGHYKCAGPYQEYYFDWDTRPRYIRKGLNGRGIASIYLHKLRWFHSFNLINGYQTLILAQEDLDNRLINQGYVLLTERQFATYRTLM